MNQIIASDNDSRNGELLNILLRVTFVVAAIAAVLLPFFPAYNLPFAILSIGMAVSWLTGLVLRARMRTTTTSAVLMLMTSAVLAVSRITVPQEIAIYFASAFLVFIPTAGLIFGRPGAWATVMLSTVLMWLDSIYRLQTTGGSSSTIALTGVLYTIMFWICGLLVDVSAAAIARAMKRSRESEQALAVRNVDLEHEVTVRQNAEGQLRTSAARARAMLEAVNELLTCDTLDDIWLRAVELAREKLGVERCAIFLLSDDGQHLSGTYGTDMAGETTDEHSHQFEVAEQFWIDTFRKLDGKDQNYWSIRTESPTNYWKDGKLQQVGTGWVAFTPLWARSGKAMGVFFNDAQRSGGQPDHALQDALAVYCAQVSNISETKRLEEALRDSNAELEERVLERTEQLEIERDHLEVRVAERTRELFKLIDASRMFAVTLELRPLLALILSKMREVIAFDASAIGLMRGNDTIEFIYYDGPQPPQIVSSRWPAEAVGNRLYHTVLVDRKSVLLPDTHDEGEFAVSFQEDIARLLGTDHEFAKSAVFVPLMVGDRVLGAMALLHGQRGFYTESHASLAMGFAAYIAIALENARLYQAAVRAATNAERSRLARELHDSVSQALYGITLGTRTAMEYAARGKGNLSEPMQFVLTLAEGALAEMRALIFELRPESLAQEGLIGAFRKQAQSLVARHGLSLLMDLGDVEPNLSIERKEALYRITLEAIQNTLKHSGASQVSLRMRCDTQYVTVEVGDNGRGFAADANYPGHYGLHTMRERAQHYGGSILINSTPNKGTTVIASLPLIGEQSEFQISEDVFAPA